MTEVIKSPEDKREYRVVTLPNALKALLISDPVTDKVPFFSHLTSVITLIILSDDFCHETSGAVSRRWVAREM